jgi:hypothetical protein
MDTRPLWPENAREVQDMSVLTLLTLFPLVAAQAPDAWAGTWALNLTKSTYQLSAAPRSSVSKLDPSGEDWTITQDVVDAQGKALHTETRAKFDGKDYPVEGLVNVTYALTRIDDHTYDLVTKRDGAVATTTRTVVSPDGRTRTSTTTGRTAQGQMARNVAVYDRQ